jgi:hypothetical protein
MIVDLRSLWEFRSIIDEASPTGLCLAPQKEAQREFWSERSAIN